MASRSVERSLESMTGRGVAQRYWLSGWRSRLRGLPAMLVDRFQASLVPVPVPVPALPRRRSRRR
jgi:hypothetical protein